ncbi:hypothetical protein NP233_g3776 [Leucocoprinus birnbaumii]|uniref:Polymerase nucleotidyl transferase domain-containing protein n=1 Tax=Leucocoprinus birnbaumii TaxID=56174 RepID=A0AAD5VVX5_9AGAR|nr:hypothetical protein NP233_g3776 [Leucocoprinus birnbaumii]
MSIPTFGHVRQCLVPGWEDEEYKRDILWAGVYGSVARNRAKEDSDVDVLIVLKEHERVRGTHRPSRELGSPTYRALDILTSRAGGDLCPRSVIKSVYSRDQTGPGATFELRLYFQVE